MSNEKIKKKVLRLKRDNDSTVIEIEDKISRKVQVQNKCK